MSPLSLLLFPLIVSSEIISLSDSSYSPFNSAGPTLQVSTLVQNYIYELTIIEGNSSSPENRTTIVVSFAQEKNHCEGYVCYYGWIHNITRGQQTIQGWGNAPKKQDFAFGIEAYLNGTFSVIKNNQQNSKVIEAINLTVSLLNPLFLQLSSLNTFLQSPALAALSVYNFVSEPQALWPNSLFQKEVAVNLPSSFFQVNEVLGINSLLVGWNVTKSNGQYLDALLLEEMTGILVKRQFKVSRENPQQSMQKKVEVVMESNHMFKDITSVVSNIEELRKESKNVERYPMHPRTIQLSLLPQGF